MEDLLKTVMREMCRQHIETYDYDVGHALGQ